MVGRPICDVTACPPRNLQPGLHCPPVLGVSGLTWEAGSRGPQRGDARLGPAVLNGEAQEVEHRAQQASGTPQKPMGQALDFLWDQQGSESFTSSRG